MTFRPNLAPWLHGLCLAVVFTGVAITSSAQPTVAAPDAVLATVDGQPIRQSDLEFLVLLRRLPEGEQQRLRSQLVEELIDQELLRAFLADRKTEASAEELDAHIAVVRGTIARGGKNPDEEFARLGITDDVLRRSLALPLAWQRYARQVITRTQITEHFAAHRNLYDGTRRRVSQIVLTLPADADEAARMAALERLRTLRADLETGKTTFAEAARTHSDSPSKAAGGDVGWVVHGTRLPREIAEVAFRTPLRTVSEPFLTRFGAHLVTATEEEPGDLSLEDVRGEVLADLGRTLWNEQLTALRAAAGIERAR